MASVVEICNRALQKLGAKRIVSIDEDSVNGRACKTAYESLRDSEMQAHRWSFGIQRYSLAVDATAPAFGRTNAFPLPSGYLQLLTPDPETNTPLRDWVVEDGKIMTNESAPLRVRCIVQVTDANKMHPLFREALSCKMAMEMCEELTQSNSKKASAKDDYKDAIAQARKANAIQSVPVQPPEDTWITGRS